MSFVSSAIKDYDLVARVATQHDVDKVVRFYTDHPHNNVVLRKKEEYERSILLDLFHIVETPKGEMVAGSGIYILGDGKQIFFEQRGQEEEWGVVAELGSVRRWRPPLPAEKRHKDMFHSYLFTVPAILLSQRVGIRPERAGKPAQLPVDYLVTSVFTTETESVNRLQGQVTLPFSHDRVAKKKKLIFAPLHMRLFNPADGYKEAFLNTTDDPTAGRDKYYLKLNVGNLPSIAAYLQQCIRVGLVNRSDERLSIDMSDLIERWTIGYDDSNRRITVLDKMVANVEYFQSYAEVGWLEYGRNKASIQPLEAKPMAIRNGATSLGYHMRHHDDEETSIPQGIRAAGYVPPHRPMPELSLEKAGFRRKRPTPIVM